MFRVLISLLTVIALAAPFKASFAADYTETFDSGVAQGWTAPAGWVVDGGTFHHNIVGGQADIAVYGGGSWATDFIYHAKISNGFNNTGNLAGVVYNYQDTNNYYTVEFAALGGTAYLNKVIGGTTTTVASASYPGGGPNVWFDVDVIRIGTGTTVKVNGTAVFNNVTQNELGTGRIALITSFSDARFDNVSLTGGLRDPMKWPFAGSSIWNMPIGGNAVYAPANLPPIPFNGTHHSSAVGQADIAVYGGIAAANFTYHVRISNGFSNAGNLAGAAYNYQNASNYYAVEFSPMGMAQLIKVIGGTTTTVATAPYSGGGQNVWFDVDVIRSGTSTTAKVNGVTVFNNVIQNELGAGNIALITTFADARFDNVAFTDTGSGASFSENFDSGFANGWTAASGVWKVKGDPNDLNYFLGLPWVDLDIIVLTPTAPLTDIYFNSAAWTGADRCPPDAPPTVLFNLPVPSNYIVPNGGGNNSSAFLKPDWRTLIQTQPFTRCVAGGPGTTLTAPSQFPPADLYADGIRGSHGGSGLSAIGGSLRVGELRPTSQGPRHVLKVSFDSAQVLFNCQPPRTPADCFRWPANTADDWAPSSPVGYGTDNPTNRDNPAMKMGALLAIPASVNLATLGLETTPAMQLAWTLQNYGAYIDDSSGIPSFVIGGEMDGPDGSSLQQQFQSDWGFPIMQFAGDNTSWSRDMQRLMAGLRVVDNNSPSSIGGGGTPRQPLAPPLAVTRSEESAATTTGSWTAFGSGTGTFSGRTMVASNVTGSTATFSFTGTAVSWIGVKCDSCGIASVSIDGGSPTSVDTTAGPAGSLTSEAVFYASGLATGVSHTIAISVTGTTTSPSGGTNIAVDAFDVMP